MFQVGCRHYKEQVYLVDKKIDYDTARSIAEKHYGNIFRFHCANYNGEFSHFNYPEYRDRTKTHYVFIGRIE